MWKIILNTKLLIYILFLQKEKVKHRAHHYPTMLQCKQIIGPTEINGQQKQVMHPSGVQYFPSKTCCTILQIVLGISSVLDHFYQHSIVRSSIYIQPTIRIRPEKTMQNTPLCLIHLWEKFRIIRKHITIRSVNFRDLFQFCFGFCFIH